MSRLSGSGASGGSDDPRREALREFGKMFRRAVTDALQAAGVEGGGFAAFSEMVNRGLFGMTASGLRAQFGVPKSGLVRDYLPPLWLSALTMVEVGVTEGIAREKAQGTAQCLAITKRVIVAVQPTLRQLRAG